MVRAFCDETFFPYPPVFASLIIFEIPHSSTWKKKKKRIIDIWLIMPSCYPVGEGSGTPLQYCCPENPMDGGAW